MQISLGKLLKYKDNSSSLPVKVLEKTDEWVKMDDNTMIREEKIKDIFVEYNSPAPDVESFFENNSTLSTLAKQFGEVIQNPDAPHPAISVAGTETESLLIDRDIDAEKKRMIADNIELQKKHLRENQQSLAMQGFQPDDGGEVMEIDADEFRAESTVRPGMVRHHSPVAVDDPMGVFVDNMKRTKKINFKMEVMQIMPPLDAIRNFENMFSYNIMERLSKEIAQTILKNPKLLEDAIYKQLDGMVNPPKKRKIVEVKTEVPVPVVPKKRAKKPTVKHD